MHSYLIAFGFLLFQMAFAQPVKIMSYNIRYDNPRDGVNAWANRVDQVVGLIQKYDPDLIGVQEALHHQLQDISRLLPGYSYVGVGRDDGKRAGEYSAILYKHGRFGLLTSSTFWLSETPTVPASKSWDAAITRIATWARFFDKEANAELLMVNTHFDHVGKLAREQSALLIKSKLAELSKQQPVLVTGDFNCTPSEAAYQQMISENDFRLFDSSQGNSTGTFCGFEVGSITCSQIDYIFYSSEWDVLSYRVATDFHGKYYPSDHLPVLAHVELSSGK